MQDLDARPGKQPQIRMSRAGIAATEEEPADEGLYGVRWVKMGSLVTSLKMTKATKAMMSTKAA